MDGSLVQTDLQEVDATTLAYLEELRREGLVGECASDLANRVVSSTDNSIYQIMPQAVLYPKSSDDLDLIMRVANRDAFKSLKFYARGGGTSTNGQSLGPGVVVDTSRHMRGILEFDPDTGNIRVEPGLIRDKLNDFLKPHGRFFAPHVSTTNRATIGGMVSNESSGKGSVVYGKTSDHVVSVECVLPNGDVAELGTETDPASNHLTQQIDETLAPHHDGIRARFPDLKRGFTGYNLKHARDKDGTLNLAKLISGSEGTLALIKSITLKTEPISAHTALVVLTYESHDAGLRAVPGLLSFKPHAIEFIDDKIMGAALRSPFADDVCDVLGIEGDTENTAAHFFEMSDDDVDVLQTRLTEFAQNLENLPQATRPAGFRVVSAPQDIARVWEIRRACQGLLAGFDKNKRAVAFIEDCAVPPENLADFVSELEETLDALNIPLGMYGHADVGCVHIRPLMNLNAADERRQIRVISDAVFELTQKYGGLLWGEHGKGMRGEYSEEVIGPELYNVMRKIKGIFDPDNRMNPGKIARPLDDPEPVLPLDAVPMRGAFDQDVVPDLAEPFANALRCDGNGACFNLDDDVPFCPSYKATDDRRQSPKGRASLLRTWVRERSLGNENGAQSVAEELHNTLDTCLSCKSCAGAGCPARVDIPEMKSLFLDWFFSTRRRPLSDHIVSRLETLAPLLDRFGGILNAAQSFGAVQRIVEHGLGLVDLPKLRNRRTFLRRQAQLGVPTLTVQDILSLPKEQRDETVVVVQDCFTTFYDADVVLAQLELIQKLGYKPVLLAYRPGGKPLHVRGFIDRFEGVAKAQARDLAKLHAAGFTLVGVDSATTLLYRQEYPAHLRGCPDFEVALLSEWLSSIDLPRARSTEVYTMIQHCTERSTTPSTTQQWVDAFDRVGVFLEIINTGCCGMSGLFGHEARNRSMSEALYNENWRDIVSATPAHKLIATGYSCRSQVKRFSGETTLHPAQALLEVL